MKELRISLSDAMVEALEAEIAAGEAGSIEELIEAALDAFLDPCLDDPGMPTREEMIAEAAAIEAEIAAGAETYTAEEVLAHVRAALRG
jgi:Ribbon-helix-helix protein, copG family